MKIDLIHKTTKEIIDSFECDANDFKIINENFNWEIKIKISKVNYEYLELLNYTICWYSDSICGNGSLSESELHEMSLSNRKYYITFPLLEMDDDMLDNFYNSKIFGFNYVEKELKKVDYKERHYKSGNLLIYVDNKLIDTQESILKEKIIYSV